MSLTANQYSNAAARLGCSVAIIRAIAMIESSEAGFYASGAIKKRFEPAVFKRRTGQTASTYAAAYELNAKEAMMSTSWGMFQVMGFNHVAAGYSSVEAMVEDYQKSEAVQLDSFVKLILAWKLNDELRDLKYAAIARAYNGINYAMNDYDTKLEKYYKQFEAAPFAGLEKRRRF